MMHVILWACFVKVCRMWVSWSATRYSQCRAKLLTLLLKIFFNTYRCLMIVLLAMMATQMIQVHGRRIDKLMVIYLVNTLWFLHRIMMNPWQILLKSWKVSTLVMPKARPSLSWCFLKVLMTFSFLSHHTLARFTVTTLPCPLLMLLVEIFEWD